MPENQEKRDDATKVDVKMAATEADILEKLKMDGRVAYKREGLYFALEQDTNAEDGYRYLGPYDENFRPVEPPEYEVYDDFDAQKNTNPYNLPDAVAVSVYTDTPRPHYEDKNVWGLTEGTSREFVDYKKLMEAVDALAVEAKRLHVVKERPLAALVDKAMSKLFPKKKDDAKEKGRGKEKSAGMSI